MLASSARHSAAEIEGLGKGYADAALEWLCGGRKQHVEVPAAGSLGEKQMKELYSREIINGLDEHAERALPSMRTEREDATKRDTVEMKRTVVSIEAREKRWLSGEAKIVGLQESVKLKLKRNMEWS